MCMSVDIAGKHEGGGGGGSGASLLSCLAATLATELLQGDTAYECSRCEQRTAATKTIQLHKLPAVYVVHINRAQWSVHGTGKREKVHTPVTFPMYLGAAAHLAPFLSHEAREVYCPPAAADGVWYRLQSVVVHAGRGIDTGHYTALAFDAARDTWLLLDDHRVSVALSYEVLHAQAFMLLYERIPADAVPADVLGAPSPPSY